MRQKKYHCLRSSFLGASYGQSKTILLLYFLLWAGLRDDVDHGTDARG